MHAISKMFPVTPVEKGLGVLGTRPLLKNIFAIPGNSLALKMLLMKNIGGRKFFDVLM
jgi:hypothetical protein